MRAEWNKRWSTEEKLHFFTAYGIERSDLYNTSINWICNMKVQSTDCYGVCIYIWCVHFYFLFKNFCIGVPLWCSSLRIQYFITVVQVAAVVQIWSLAWELPHARVQTKKKKKKFCLLIFFHLIGSNRGKGTNFWKILMIIHKRQKALGSRTCSHSKLLAIKEVKCVNSLFIKIL